VQTDESGAPWPYEAVEPAQRDPGKPTWECPGGSCDCHPPEGEAERHDHTILFFDPEAKKMPGARCRVLEGDQLLNKDAPFADGSGAVAVKVRPRSRVLELEWAPADLPVRPGYPYRKQYYLDLGHQSAQCAERRMHNLGFSAHPTLEANVRDFQRTYLQPETGRIEDVEVQLASFHDEGLLPPVPASSGAPAPTTRSSLAGAPDPGAQGPVLGAQPTGGPTPTGGVKAQGSVTAVQMTKLRIRIRTRAIRGVLGAAVTLDTGPTNKTAKADAQGFVTFTLTKSELDATQPPGWVTVRVKVRHHGPDPGPFGTVKPGELSSMVAVLPSGFAADQPLISKFDDSTPGLVTDVQGTFLDMVLMDAGMNQKAQALTITRRMTDDEVQKELMFHHVSGLCTLAAGSEPQFEHDTEAEEFGPCTAACRLKSPTIDRRVALLAPTIWNVTFYLLTNFGVSPASTADKIPGARFSRDRFSWNKTTLQTLDQRHVVGLARLCSKLNADHGIVAIFTQGVNGDTGRKDTHGYGLALDLGGASKAQPDRSAKSGTVRLGVDFLVFLHWGRTPMWDPATVARNPGNSAAWSRLTKAFDDGTDYSADPDGTAKKLHYRLDPAPFQDAVPADTDPALGAELAEVAGHFVAARAIFKAIYDFAVDEYSDDNALLGPLPAGASDTPTPIDSHVGHFILYPDYPKPNTNPSNGRQAHNNHLHFQLGPTHYPRARTT
jgi:hypothetical protein